MEGRLFGEKVAKSWEKGALSRRGREGVNNERTCLWLNTHSCSEYMHTRTEEELDARECTESFSETNTCLLFCQRGDNVNNARLQSRKANKHSCYMPKYGQTQTHIPHACDHKVSYHTNSGWLTSWGGKRNALCACLCVPPLNRVSLMTQSPAFSAQNSVSSAFTKDRAIRSKPPGPTQRLQCSTPRDNASIFKSFIYTHPFSYLRTDSQSSRLFS